MIKADALQQQRLEQFFAVKQQHMGGKVTEIKMLGWFLVVIACIVLAIPTGDRLQAAFLISAGSVNMIGQGFATLARLYSLQDFGRNTNISRALPVGSAQLTIYKWRKTRGKVFWCTLITLAARVVFSLLDDGAIDLGDVLIPTLILLGVPLIGYLLALIPYSEV